MKRAELPSAPLCIVIHGLASAPEQYGWLVDSLSHEFEVMSYWRAGYGPSVSEHSELGIDQGADDLADLVREMSRSGRSVFLVCHSLGGVIARQALSMCGDRVTGIIYIDSSHSRQLRISETQWNGVPQLREMLDVLPLSLRMGLGTFFRVPAWVKGLPDWARKSAELQYRDARLWTAASAEWRDAEYEMRRSHSTTEEVADVPALLLWAEQTMSSDPAQAEISDQLSRSHRSSSCFTVRAADHMSIVTNKDVAGEVANMISSFAKSLDRP